MIPRPFSQLPALLFSLVLVSSYPASNMTFYPPVALGRLRSSSPISPYSSVHSSSFAFSLLPSSRQLLLLHLVVGQSCHPRHPVSIVVLVNPRYPVSIVVLVNSLLRGCWLVLVSARPCFRSTIIIPEFMVSSYRSLQRQLSLRSELVVSFWTVLLTSVSFRAGRYRPRVRHEFSISFWLVVIIPSFIQCSVSRNVNPISLRQSQRQLPYLSFGHFWSVSTILRPAGQLSSASARCPFASASYHRQLSVSLRVNCQFLVDCVIIIRCWSISSLSSHVSCQYRFELSAFIMHHQLSVRVPLFLPPRELLPAHTIVSPFSKPVWSVSAPVSLWFLVNRLFPSHFVTSTSWSAVPFPLASSPWANVASVFLISGQCCRSSRALSSLSLQFTWSLVVVRPLHCIASLPVSCQSLQMFPPKFVSKFGFVCLDILSSRWSLVIPRFWICVSSAFLDHLRP
jgi:hypothetical protein